MPVHMARGARQRGHVCGGSGPHPLALFNLLPQCQCAPHVTRCDAWASRCAAYWRASCALVSCSRRASASVRRLSSWFSRLATLTHDSDDVVANVFRCLQASSWPSLSIAQALPPASPQCFYNEGNAHAPPLPLIAGGGGSSGSSSSAFIHCNIWAHSRSEFIT